MEPASDEIPDYPRPEGDVPYLPDSLTDLDDVQLIDLLTALTAWHDYADTRLSYLVIENRRADIRTDEVEAEAMVQNWGGTSRDSVRITEAKRDITEEVQDCRQQQLNAYAMRKAMETRVNRFERDAFVVSRELTRRTNMEPVQRRERRWGGS